MEKAELIWHNGEFVAWDEAQVHVLSHGLHYGTGVFEGERCYETARGPAIFRHADHLDRLAKSAELFYLPLPYSTEEIAEATRETGIRISLLAQTDGCTAGFLLGRLYYGEFGLPEPVAIVDSIGVDPGFQGRHVGRALLHQLETNLRAIGIEAVQTQVEWRQGGLLSFLAAGGFQPVPTLTLEKRLGSAT